MEARTDTAGHAQLDNNAIKQTKTAGGQNSWKPPPVGTGFLAVPGDDAESVPLDHTLPDYLAKISGSSDLTTVKKLRLRLPPRHSSLTRVSTCLPALRSLTLDGSSLGSLRHLGLGLAALRELSVVNCGLDSLDGLFGLPVLRNLWAGFNQIEDIASLTALTRLRSADLRANQVTDVEYVGFLHICCPRLTELVLADNPCANDPDYRTRVRALLPRLHSLDGSPLPELTEETSHALNTDFALDNGEEEEEEDDDDYDDDEDSCKSLPEFGNEAARAERLWTNSDSRPSTSDRQFAMRSQKPATFRPYEEGPLSPAPQLFKEVSYGWSLSQENEGPASPLTSGGVVCGNLSAALRSRSRKTNTHTKDANAAGDFVRSRGLVNEVENLYSARIDTQPSGTDSAK